MTYLQRKKLAFMSIVNSVKGFVRKVSGILPLTLPNCFDDNGLIDYSISGNVGGVGDKTINLLDMDSYVQSPGYIISETNGEKTWQGGSRTIVENFIEVEPNTDYWMGGESLNTQYNEIHIFAYDSEQSYIGKITGGYKIWWTFTTPDNCKYIRFYYNNIENLMLKHGSKKTEYEPWGYKIPIVCSNPNVESIITTIYLKEPLTEGQIITYTEDNLPTLPTIPGTTIYSVDTTTQPSNMEVTYYATQKG